MNEKISEICDRLAEPKNPRLCWRRSSRARWSPRWRCRTTGWAGTAACASTRAPRALGDKPSRSRYRQARSRSPAPWWSGRRQSRTGISRGLGSYGFQIQFFEVFWKKQKILIFLKEIEKKYFANFKFCFYFRNELAFWKVQCLNIIVCQFSIFLAFKKFFSPHPKMAIFLTGF